MKSITDLVGCQLVSIDDKNIVVKKGERTYELDIVDQPISCCGYNRINTQLLISGDELERNPIITNVESHTDLVGGYAQSCLVTFFGEAKPLAELSTYSSSGSGWCYGACVTVRCKQLRLEETLSQW